MSANKRNAIMLEIKKEIVGLISSGNNETNKCYVKI